MTLASPVAIKVSLGEEIRRFQASREETWDGLKERVGSAHTHSFSMTYFQTGECVLLLERQNKTFEHSVCFILD